jgi:hypothetical protein
MKARELRNRIVEDMEKFEYQEQVIVINTIVC